MRIPTILILDCNHNGEASEGVLLEEFFKSPRLRGKVRVRYERVLTRKRFLQLVGGSQDNMIHISGHGAILNKRQLAARLRRGKPHEKMFLQLPRGGEIYPSDIPRISGKTKLVFLNACSMLWKKMADKLPYSTFYIAPFYDVDHEDAMVYAVRFYQNVFVKHMKYNSARAVTSRELSMQGLYPYSWGP